MKKIKLPNPVILVVGGLSAFWIADIINPGFNPIGVMILLLIPILIVEMLYPQPEMEQLIEQAHYASLKNAAQESPVELIEEEASTEEVAGP